MLKKSLLLFGPFYEWDSQVSGAIKSWLSLMQRHNTLHGLAYFCTHPKVLPICREYLY